MTRGIYHETWMCSRKQYGLGSSTKPFAAGAKWKDWDQYIKDTAHDDERTQDYLSYSWQPDDCSLLPMDADSFAAQLEKRNVFIIGDSLSEQHFLSIGCILGDKAVYGHSTGRQSAKITGDLVRYFKIPAHKSKVKAEGLGGEKDIYGR